MSEYDANEMESTNEQTALLDALGERFDRSVIKQREGYGGKMLDYLSTDTVIRRLNKAAKGWSFVIKDLRYQGDLCIVIGSLTIPGLGTREGIGVQQIMQGRGGEDLHKGAASDALKKASTLYGVGLELYGPDLEELAATGSPINYQQAPQRHQQAPGRTQPYQPSPSTAQGQQPPQASPTKAISPKQINMVWGRAKDKGWDDHNVHAYIFDEFHKESLSDLSSAEASKLIDVLMDPSTPRTYPWSEPPY